MFEKEKHLGTMMQIFEWIFRLLPDWTHIHYIGQMLISPWRAGIWLGSTCNVFHCMRWVGTLISSSCQEVGIQISNSTKPSMLVHLYSEASHFYSLYKTLKHFPCDPRGFLFSPGLLSSYFFVHNIYLTYWPLVARLWLLLRDVESLNMRPYIA